MVRVLQLTVNNVLGHYRKGTIPFFTFNEQLKPRICPSRSLSAEQLLLHV